MVPSRSLDCNPVDPTAPVGVSDADLARIQPVQQVLLSPLDHATVDDWRGAVNRTLMEAFGSDAAMFQLDGADAPLHVCENLDPGIIRRYGDQLVPELQRERRLFQRVVEGGAGNRLLLWDTDLEWLYGSEYFNEMITELRAFDPLWVGAPVGAGYPTVLSTYHDRRRSDLYFDGKDVRLMAILRPALEAGVRTVMRSADTRESLTRGLDARTDGVLVYDLAGSLLHRNPALATLARTRRAEKTLVAAGAAMARGLESPDPVESLEPTNAVRTVATRTGEFRLHAVRVAAGTFGLRPTVLVSVSAGRAPLPDRATLQERYGLTRRQAEVALLLAERKTDPEIAGLLFISPHTARHHTEAVLGKLGLGDRRDVEDTIRAPAL